MSPDWSTWIASSVVAFWPTPTRSPASTFSQIPTEIVSPGRMVSGERAPAFTKPELKPSVSAEREAAAIGGVTSTTCMSRAGSFPPRLISPRVGPERGRAQPASAATRRSARAKLAVAIRGPCIDCLIALARRLLPRKLAIFAGQGQRGVSRGAKLLPKRRDPASCRAARRGLGRWLEQGGTRDVHGNRQRCRHHRPPRGPGRPARPHPLRLCAGRASPSAPRSPATASA